MKANLDFLLISPEKLYKSEKRYELVLSNPSHEHWELDIYLSLFVKKEFLDRIK
jgi:hypothetical protein